MFSFVQESLSIRIDYEDCGSLNAIRLKAEAHYNSDYQGTDDTLNLEALMTRASLVTGVNTDHTLNQEFLMRLMEERWTLTPQIGRAVAFRSSEVPLYEINARYLAFFAASINFTPRKPVYISETLANFFRQTSQAPSTQMPRSTWLGIVLPHEVLDAQFLFDLAYNEILRLRLRIILPLNAFVRGIIYHVTDEKESTQKVLWPYYSEVRPFHQRLQAHNQDSVLPSAETPGSTKARSSDVRSLPSPMSSENLSLASVITPRQFPLSPPSSDLQTSSSDSLNIAPEFLELVAILRQTSVEYSSKNNGVVIPVDHDRSLPLSYFVVHHAPTLAELNRDSSPFIVMCNPEPLFPKDYTYVIDYLEQQMALAPPSSRVKYSQIKTPQLHSLLPWLRMLIHHSQRIHFQHLGANGGYDGFSYQLRMMLPDAVVRIVFCKDERLYTKCF